MQDLLIPIIFTVAAIVVNLIAYRGIRRGGARIYTLEREILLRQAVITMFAAALLYIGAIVLLVVEIQELTAIEEEQNTVIVAPTPTTIATIISVPPTTTPTPTIDPNIPTITPTPVLRRALVDGTGGNGLYLRIEPNDDIIRTLADGAFVTLLDEPPRAGNGFNWVKVRTIDGEEGWVADT
ncbi:MAG TPA: SH3 domain-containing protein, partial [Anaerolineae bacterium]|nr:SH3 domain-containing protein [Anaerolineae bacterium]